MTFYDDVFRFHQLWHFPQTKPALLDDREWSHRVRLMSEEYAELCRAHPLRNLPDFADGLVDLTWVVLGTAVVAGLPFNELWEEVKRANMAKEDGTIDGSGKLMKPIGLEAARHRIDLVTEALGDTAMKGWQELPNEARIAFRNSTGWEEGVCIFPEEHGKRDHGRGNDGISGRLPIQTTFAGWERKP